MKKTLIIILLILILVALGIGGIFIWKKISNKSTNNVSFNSHFIDIHAHIVTDRFSLDEAADIFQLEKIDKMIIMQTPVDLSRIATPESHGIPQAAEKYPNQFAMMYQGEALELNSSE